MPLSQKTQVHNIYSRLGRHATLKGRYINNYFITLGPTLHYTCARQTVYYGTFLMNDFYRSFMQGRQSGLKTGALWGPGLKTRVVVGPGLKIGNGVVNKIQQTEAHRAGLNHPRIFYLIKCKYFYF